MYFIMYIFILVYFLCIFLFRVQMLNQLYLLLLDLQRHLGAAWVMLEQSYLVEKVVLKTKLMR